VVERLADGSHVVARALNTTRQADQVRVGSSGVYATTGTYDTELRIGTHTVTDPLAGWTQSYPDSEYPEEILLAVSPNGSVFYSSTVAVPYDGATEAYSAVFSPEGTLAWASAEAPGAATFLPSGNLLFTGVLQDDRDFGGGPISGASYLVEFDPSGDHVASWALDVTFPPGSSTTGIPRPGLHATQQYAVLEGRVWQSGLPGSLGSHDLSLSADRGWLVAAMSGPNTYSHAAVWPTVTSDSGQALTPSIHVTVDAEGRVFLCGFYYRQLVAFGRSLTAVGIEDNDADIVIAALSPGGEVLFAESFGDLGLDTCVDLAIDAEGGLLVTGRYQTGLDFGQGPLEPEPRAADDPAMMYIARFELVDDLP
jgi:hypothetical protein